MSLQVDNVIALYYAFALYTAITFYLLLHQDIKLPLTRTQCPAEVEPLLLGDPAQSTSKYPKI